MSQLVFIITSACLSCYFIFVKRYIDLTSAAFFSILFFFAPGFLGRTVIQAGWEGIYSDQIHSGTYLIMMLVMVGTFLVSLFSDVTANRFRKRVLTVDRKSEVFLYLSFWLGLSALAILIFQSDWSIFTKGQKEAIFVEGGATKGLHSVFRYSMAFSLLTGYLLARRKMFTLAGAFLLLDVYMGFRSVAAVGVLSLFVIFSINRKHVILRYGRVVASLLLCVAFFVIYKDFYIIVKTGRFSDVSRKLGRENYIEHVLCRIPGFNQVSVINECVAQKFRIPHGHFRHLVEVLAPVRMTSEDIVSFNDRFQDELFPKASGGLAGNPYAEFYAWMGLNGLLIFLFFNSICLWLLNAFYLMSDHALGKMVSAFVGCFHVFYINRCGLFQMLLIERRILIYFSGVLAASVIVYSLRVQLVHSRRESERRPTALRAE